jgi:hypothetical protein
VGRNCLTGVSRVSIDHAESSVERLTAPRYALAGLLLAAAVLRIAAVSVWRDNLHDDRDAYLALAQEVAAGKGLCTPGSDPPAPTAYRPPLYPIVLSVMPAAHRDFSLALFQVLLGTATVWLTVAVGRLLRLENRLALLAAGLVAVDPLLVQYTSMAMTETLCTFVVAALLVVVLKPVNEAAATSVWRPIATGVLFGLGVLCRPTLWAFGAFVAAWSLYYRRRFRHSPLTTHHSPLSHAWLTVLAAGLTVAPWAVRNWAQFGHPILTTTHGGYTLLLGNNPAFYAEVVDQPLGTVWDGSHGPGQAAWIDGVYREMEQAGIDSEIEGNRWMSRRAWRHIADDPRHFAQACLLRFVSFWNIVPSGPAAAGVSPFVRYGTGGYYTVVFGLALVGTVKVLRTSAAGWMPLVLLIASFSAVHLVYWSNVRMRAPVMPAVALLAAAATIGTRSASERRSDAAPAAPR